MGELLALILSERTLCCSILAESSKIKVEEHRGSAFFGSERSQELEREKWKSVSLSSLSIPCSLPSLRPLFVNTYKPQKIII